jgi:hypothetical protein
MLDLANVFSSTFSLARAQPDLINTMLAETSYCALIAAIYAPLRETAPMSAFLPIADIRSLSAFNHLRTSAGAFMPGADMRLIALIVGMAALLMGLLWIGQGAGLIHWPASSFMLDQRPWVTRGAILAAVGLALMAASRLRR